MAYIYLTVLLFKYCRVCENVMDLRCEFVPERTRRNRMEPDAAAAGGEGGCSSLLVQTSLSGIKAEEGHNQKHN